MAARLHASRLAPDGIDVSEVRPRIIEIDMVAPVIEKYKRLAEEACFRRVGWVGPKTWC
ncbi:MAG: hypothetical protein OXJ37_11405 [Bryobacterales bacterium]|nr:hypothetical protein [Bryobacterales bacterium]MDE0262998.1 hypothetical protein [Bryobacterales bacterium]MDE0621148.1 hypothetical protein [Bryobacterales bacterium]